jgi:hypothetical protein
VSILKKKILNQCTMLRLMAVVGIALTAFIVAGCAGNRQETAATQPAFSAGGIQADGLENPPPANPLEEKWGIRVEAIRLSAEGYMLDFRYRVTDPNLAAPIFDSSVHPYLVDRASGAKFIVPSPPKVGQLRNTRKAKEGKVYFMFFANPGRYVKSGNKVDIVIGDCKIENLTVQ